MKNKPNLFLVGTRTSATTFLHNYRDLHPDVINVLRLILLQLTHELSELLGRSFPEWNLLYCMKKVMVR